MIYVGLDDTDTLDTPGTNQLARHLIRELAPDLRGTLILRHQLLEDPRVPCTRKNGCASIAFDFPPLFPGEGRGEGASSSPTNNTNISALAARLRELILDWIPPGSDPGLCIATSIPAAVAGWGRRAKRELLTQREARELAIAHDIHLAGLAGTQDGIIGALAAVGLMSTRNDGRVVYLASEHAATGEPDALDITGPLSVETILARGIEAVVDHATNEPITQGPGSKIIVEVGKKLRPNYRAGRIVLYAERRSGDTYEAVRVT